MTKHSKPLTCRDTTYLVISARDTPLDAQQIAALEAHLASCSACRTASRQFSQVFEQLDTLLARDTKP